MIGLIVLFFVFHWIRRMFIWSTTFQIYFMTFVMQKINRINDKISIFHWNFQPSLISIKKWFKKFFANFICLIRNHDFCIIILWMHYTLFISVFKRNKVNCHCYQNFCFLRLFEYIYVFQVRFIFIAVFFDG